MSWDRTISWDSADAVPAMTALSTVLQDYLGDLGDVSNLGQDNSLYASLMAAPKSPSYGSFPFRQITTLEENYRLAQARHLQSRERWFEVHKHDDYISVTTRQQDEFTNNIASGFAALIARFWHGNLDLGG